jgi:hypothetical protein
MLKFSEFASDVQPMDGVKIKMVDLINQPMVVTGYKIRNSQYKKGNDRYATIQIELNHEKRVVFTGSGVLIEQLEKYGEKIPFETTILLIDRFYTFS